MFGAKPAHRIDWRKATKGSQGRDWTIDAGKEERLPTQPLKSEFIGGWLGNGKRNSPGVGKLGSCSLVWKSCSDQGTCSLTTYWSQTGCFGIRHHPSIVTAKTGLGFYLHPEDEITG